MNKRNDGRREVDSKKAFLQDIVTKAILLLLGACFSVSAWALTYVIDTESRLTKCESEIPHNKEFREAVMKEFHRLYDKLEKMDRTYDK